MSKTYKQNKFDSKADFYKKKNRYLQVRNKQRDKISDKRQFLTQKEE